VANPVTELRTLAADVTALGHDVKPPEWKSPMKANKNFSIVTSAYVKRFGEERIGAVIKHHGWAPAVIILL
jgi:hypothetical protein